VIPALALSALVAALPADLDLPAEITFEDAVRIARDRSPDVAIANAGVDAARAQVLVAGAIPNPTATFMAGWSSQCSDPGCTLPAYVAALGDQGAVAAILTGQRGLAVDAAVQGTRGAEASRRDVMRNLEYDVKRQFVATSVAWRAAGYAKLEAAHANDAVALGRKRQAAGEIPAAELSRLELLRLSVEQIVDRAELAHEQSRVALAQLLGLRDGAPAFTVVAGPTASAAPPPQLTDMTLPKLTAEAQRRRPDLAAARAAVEEARSLAALARRQVIPQFQILAQYGQQGAPGGWFTPPTASLGISLPLPVFYQQQGQIGAADAGVAVAEATVAKVEAQVVADVAGAFATYQSSRRTARRAEEQVRSLSSNVRESVGSDYAKGTASLLDYLDTERSRIQHEIEYLGTLQTFWTSVFQLERAVGVNFVP